MNRFDGAEPELTSLNRGEDVTPEERRRREMADLHDLMWPKSKPKGQTPEQREAAAARRREHHGLLNDEEARNDAVTAVEYCTDKWKIRWVLAEQAHVVVVRAVTVEPVGRETPLGGVTSNLLRELRPARAVEAGAPHFEADPQARGVREGDDLSELFARQARRTVDEIGPERSETVARRTGRPPLSEEHLARVARAYLDELRKGTPGVLRRVGQRFDREPATMRDHVRAARREGFLTKASQPGRKGGEATPRLLEFERRRDEGERDE